MGFFVKKTTERLQVDPIECGAVCLGIVLEYYGHHATNLSLRNACCVSRRGAQASSIISGAENYGLFAQAKKSLSLELRKMDVPAILFFDHSHFVVFEGYFLSHYYINDPALGRYKLDERSFRQRYSNVAIIMQKTSSFARNITHAESCAQSLSKFFMTMLGIISGVTLALLSSFFGLMLTSGRRHLVISDGVFNLVIVVLLFLMAACLWVGLGIIKKIAHTKINRDREIFSESILKNPISFYEEIPFSSFTSSYVNSVADNLTTTYGHLQVYFIAGFFCAAGLMVICIAPSLVIILGLIAILYVLEMCLRKNFGAKIGILSDTDLERASLLSLDMQAMGQGKLMTDGLLRRRLLLLPKFSFLWHAMSSGLIALLCFALIYGGYLNFVPILWHQGVIDAAGISTILIMVVIIFLVVFAFGKYEPCTVQATESFRQELVAQQDNVHTITSPSSFKNIIEVQEVAFSYRGESIDLFDAIFLTIQQGITMVVDGPPGSGKSTLLKILAGQLTPKSGSIRQKKDMRIALINDQTKVMNATLRDNVTLYDDGVSDERVVWALEQSCALDLYYNRSLGLLATIDHDGFNLSASEIKRLLLASALVHKPDIILLDNFFDGLDKETSEKIFENLKKLKIAVVFTAADEHLQSQACQNAVIKSKTVIVEDRV